MDGDVLLAALMTAFAAGILLYTENSRLRLRLLWNEIRAEYQAMVALEARIDAALQKKHCGVAMARLPDVVPDTLKEHSDD